MPDDARPQAKLRRRFSNLPQQATIPLPAGGARVLRVQRGQQVLDPSVAVDGTETR